MRAEPGTTANGGQGFHLEYSSGYTQGVVGFGVDPNACLGIKLDSGRGRSGSGLLPVDSSTNRADDEFGSLDGAVNMRLSSSELKHGQLRPYNPVIAVADARLVPATATGFQLTSAELDELIIDAGHFTSSRDFNQACSRDGFYSICAPGRQCRLCGGQLGGQRCLEFQRLCLALRRPVASVLWQRHLQPGDR